MNEQYLGHLAQGALVVRPIYPSVLHDRRLAPLGTVVRLIRRLISRSSRTSIFQSGQTGLPSPSLVILFFVTRKEGHYNDYDDDYFFKYWCCLLVY